MLRRLVVLVPLALAGCAMAPSYAPSGTRPGETPSRSAISYEPVPGRDAQTVAQMRAAPPPQDATIDFAREGEEARLAAQGYVRIGRGRFPIEQIAREREADARAEAQRQAAAGGAERVLLAPPRDGIDAAWIADYYVRFRLPFGASFRDLRDSERATLGAQGGVAIGAVVNGTPASRANLLTGDVVLALDGKPIADRADFQQQLKRNAGHAVTLTLVRNGETLRRAVRLGAMPEGAGE
ncbi:MAG: PDZ domain-containing protein [Dokdonella sp.]|uniref:PDZ domain-containing protein n=1 Tax=Dokdonella sp. TaxID=2291710 RepID=UPI003F7FC997